MTSGEWSFLILFAWDSLNCSEQAGIEKIKMKINVSSGIRTHASPRHDRWISALNSSNDDDDVWINVLQDSDNITWQYVSKWLWFHVYLNWLSDLIYISDLNEDFS